MKYPYIGKGLESGTIALIFKPDHSITIDSKTWATRNGEIENSIREDYFKNITHEYLQNTYGEVQSPEHAEFIVELAARHGLLLKYEHNEVNSFIFDGDDLLLCKAGVNDIYRRGMKQITIPLPPKADKQELSGWPQVGDEVCWSNGCYKGVVKARYWNDLWVMELDGEFSTLYIDDVSKPKTPEEEFASELIAKYKHLPNHEQAFAIARDVIDNAIAKTKKA